MTDKKYKVQITKKEDSEILLEGEISTEEFESYRKEAIKKLGEEVTLPGFRKGHVPEKILLEKVGEQTILYEMAEKALSKAYPHMLIQENIDAISQPKIAITKIATGNPLGFKIETAVMPEMELSEYKKTAKEVLGKEKEVPKTDEKEIEDALLRIRKSLAVQAQPEGDTPPEPLKDEDLPELTDEDIKKVGDYKTVEDFKIKLKESLQAEKTREHREKIRMKIVERVIEESKIEVPKVLVESELERMMSQFEHDIERMGMKPAEYLKQTGKNKDGLRGEWKPDAIKRVKLQLILAEIAKREKLFASKEDIEKETKHMLAHYPDAKEENIRVYLEHALTNEKVFEFLESQAK